MGVFVSLPSRCKFYLFEKKTLDSMSFLTTDQMSYSHVCLILILQIKEHCLYYCVTPRWVYTQENVYHQNQLLKQN